MRAFALEPSKHKWLYKDDNEVYYADVYPQRPGQAEDELNEKTAREGYTFTSQIKNETPAAFDVIQETLGASLSKLAYMGKAVISEQLSVTMPCISSYQIPEKLFMKDPNRENWGNELASPETSLFDVAQQRVPICSLKDAKLIEYCIDKEIPFQRALWFIKCVGYNDLRPQKAIPTVEQHISLSKDWTKVVSSFLLQLLNDLSTDTAGGRRSQAPAESIDIWSAKLRKLQYFITFSRLQYDENLLNKSDFLREFLKIFKIIIDKMNCINQISVLITVSSLYLDQFKQSRYFLMQLVQYSLQQFIKLKTNLSTYPDLSAPIIQLQTFLQKVAFTVPCTFVSLNIWRSILPVRKDIFSVEKSNVRLPIEYHRKLSRVEAEIKSRIERLFPVAKHRESTRDLKSLLSASETDYTALNTLDDISFHSTASEFLYILNWAIEGTFFRPARSFEACKFLQEKCNVGKLRHFLFEYLDGVIMNLENSQSQRLYYFLGVLEEFNLFSLSYFLQYSLARKDLDKNNPESNAYLIFLAEFPIRLPDSSFLEMRSLWLSRKSSDEEEQISQCRNWICERLPTMLGSDQQVHRNLQQPVGNDFESYESEVADPLFSHLATMSAFVRLRVGEWLKKAVFQYVVYSQAIGLNNWKTLLNAGASLLNPRQLQIVILIYESLMDHLTLLEVCIWLLQNSSERSIHMLTLSVLVKHRHIYSYFGKSQLICKIIISRFAAPKPKHATPLVFHTLLFYSNCCDDHFDLELIKQSYNHISTKRSIDLKYLKEFKEDASIAIASQKLIADCTDIDNAAKILQHVIQSLQTHNSTDSPAEFYKRMELFSYLFAQLQECGTFMEDAIHGFLLNTFVNQFHTSLMVSYQPWMIDFVLELVLIRSYCIRKFIDHIVMPILVLLKSDPQKIEFIGKLLVDWVSLLDLVVNCQFHYGVKQIIAAPSVLFISLSTKEGAVSIFHLASILHYLDSHIPRPHNPASDIINTFLGKLIHSENWFKDYFRSEHRNFESAILFDDPQTAKSSCAIFCNLLHPDSSFVFPDSAETCILTFSSMLETEPAPEIEIILKLILRFASSQSKSQAPGWDMIMASLFSIMTEGSHKADIAPFTSQFSEEFKSFFFDYFLKIQEIFIECKGVLTEPLKKLPNDPILDESIWPFLLKRIQLWVSSVFSHYSSSKDEKRDLKKQIIAFLVPLIQVVISIQEKLSFFEERLGDVNSMVTDGISFKEFCTLLKTAVGLMQIMTKYLLDFQEELEIVPLLQSLFLMLPSRALTDKHLAGMQISIFDIAAIFSEDLSKSKTKEMTGWIAENTPILLRNEKVKDQIMTLLPFSDTNLWFNGLSVSNDGVVTSVESQFVKPWEIVSRGKTGPEFDPAIWKLPTMIEKLNDTPFSLAHFNAKVVRPGPQTFDSLYEHGWRPKVNSEDMRVEEEILVIPEDLLLKLTAKIETVRSLAKKDIPNQNGSAKLKRNSVDLKKDRKKQKKSV